MNWIISRICGEPWLTTPASTALDDDEYLFKIIFLWWKSSIYTIHIPFSDLVFDFRALCAAINLPLHFIYDNIFTFWANELFLIL